MNHILEIGHTEESILLALIENGPSTASDIAQKTGIKKNKIYSFLKKLTDERLIDPLPKVHGQEVYRPIKEEIERLTKKSREHVRAVLEDLSKIERRLDNYPQTPAPRLSQEIWIGPPQNAIEQTRRICLQAESSILISTYVFDWLESIENVLFAKSIDQRVPVTVTMMNPASNDRLSPDDRKRIDERIAFLKRRSVNIELTDILPPFRGSIVDRRVCLLMMFPYPKRENYGHPVGYALCRNSAIVELLTTYYNMFFGKFQVIKKNTPNSGRKIGRQ